MTTQSTPRTVLQLKGPGCSIVVTLTTHMMHIDAFRTDGHKVEIETSVYGADRLQAHLWSMGIDSTMAYMAKGCLITLAKGTQYRFRTMAA